MVDIIGGNNGGQGLGVNINPNDIQPKNCEKCNCPIFRQVYTIGIIKGIQVGQTQDSVFPMQHFSCAACGWILGSQSDESEDKPKCTKPEGVSVSEEIVENSEEEEPESNVIKFERS